MALRQKCRLHLWRQADKQEKASMEMIGTKQAAEITGRSQQTISRWCRTGRIKGAEQDGVGSPWRMPLESFLKMVRQKN